MTIAELLPLILKASIMMVVFALGLHTQPGDLTYVLRRPGLLARSLLSMNVVTLIAAVGLVMLMDLSRPMSILLVALSLAPVPPILPKKQAKAGGHAAYAIGLLAAAAAISVIWIPLALEIIQRLFGIHLGLAPLQVGVVVLQTVIGPLLAGVLVRLSMPTVAEYVAPAFGKLGGGILAISALLLIVAMWKQIMQSVGDGSLIAILALTFVGLIAGHILGGPDPNDRTVLALASAARHPGVALAIATVNFPNEKGVLGALLLYVLVGALAAAPYVAWRKREGAADLAIA